MGNRAAGKINFALATFISLLFFLANTTSAQTQNIEIGMFVKIAPCAKGSKTFKHIDLYIKSLVPDTIIPIDSLTGEGVYESFFVKGSEIDGKRLPCSYGNKKYKVAALREFELKGQATRIMLLYGNIANEMIWVVFDDAVESSEISW